MAFETIDCIGAASAASTKVPEDGVCVTARKLGQRGGGHARYLRLVVGAALAKAISLQQEHHTLRLLLGTGPDAGKLQISVDNAGGTFVAKRDKQGRYVITINAATADGLFAMEFPDFARSGLEAVRPQNGQPPHFVFKASEEMLKVED